MGYSSDVRMVIRGPKEVILREFAGLRLQGDSAMQEALDEWWVMSTATLHLRDGNTADAAVAILGKGGTNWKWYESYSNVQAHSEVFRHFSELYDNNERDATALESYLEGAFVRIGENDDDIKTDYFGDSGYDLARPVRSIECFYDDLDSPELRPRLSTSEA
jgi:hypothetical protein